MFVDFIHTFLLLFNLQPTSTEDATTTSAPESSTTSEPEPPCSPEDNVSQVQPEDNNLTSLNGIEINLTNDPGSSQEQCNTFEPRQDATAGESLRCS